MNHVEVVSLIKELSADVCFVCLRSNQLIHELTDKSEVLDSFLQSGANKAFESLSLSAGDRLVKAKSDGSLAIVNPNGDFSRCKSRSLEPLSGLAMWSTESQLIELIKGDRGLGFSILDYQVSLSSFSFLVYSNYLLFYLFLFSFKNPLNPNETVIVIRSLVPGGVAQQDGRLIPGDRLLAVNDTSLTNATLDVAVQALKGASKGIVRILVAKPLPLTEQTAAQFIPSNRSDKHGLSVYGIDQTPTELEQQVKIH